VRSLEVASIFLAVVDFGIDALFFSVNVDGTETRKYFSIETEFQMSGFQHWDMGGGYDKIALLRYQTVYSCTATLVGISLLLLLVKIWLLGRKRVFDMLMAEQDTLDQVEEEELQISKQQFSDLYITLVAGLDFFSLFALDAPQIFLLFVVKQALGPTPTVGFAMIFQQLAKVVVFMQKNRTYKSQYSSNTICALYLASVVFYVSFFYLTIGALSFARSYIDIVFIFICSSMGVLLLGVIVLNVQACV
jgi:hypothetical protein